MKADLYNVKGTKTGTVELPDRVFGRKWSAQLVHQALVGQIKNSRQVLAHAKGRDEVRGGGKKPWAQKHTGRARHSSIRSPIWKGGGVAHGPSKDVNFSVKVNKRARQAAIFAVLSRKLKDGEVKVVESLSIQEPKTKNVAELLGSLVGLSKKMAPSTLIIPDLMNKNIYKASRNIPKTKSLSPKALNVYDLMRYKNILLDQQAVAAIDSTYVDGQKDKKEKAKEAAK